MCNFGGQTDLPDMEQVMRDFRRELEHLDPGTRFLHWGPGGSVLSEKENGSALRVRLVEALATLPFLEGFGLETRAETVTEGRIQSLLDVLPHHVTELAIGLGLESVNELVLRVAVNKGERIDHTIRAIDRIANVDRDNEGRRIVADCYVLLKPPFLTESEAIEDAIRSITWAYDRGVDTVTLFVNTIKDRTLCKHLSLKTDAERPFRYQTPYLYSALEVLAGLPPDYRNRTNILGFTSGNPYEGAARACPLCWHVLHGLISAHNYTRDPAIFAAAREVRCGCRDAWLTEIKETAPRPMRTRFHDYIGRLEREFELKSKHIRDKGA